jgi:hypothetical protein
MGAHMGCLPQTQFDTGLGAKHGWLCEYDNDSKIIRSYVL